jgi:hypothetical protein
VRLSLSRRGRRERCGDGILARDGTRELKVALDGGFVGDMIAPRYAVFRMNIFCAELNITPCGNCFVVYVLTVLQRLDDKAPSSCCL